MLDELTPTHITAFKGLFANGPSESCPPNHGDIVDNMRFINGGIETRYGTSVSHEVSAVRRFFPYSIEGQSDRTIYLDNAGQIFDSLYPGAPILMIIGMQDFSMLVLNDRAYLSPHNGTTGMPGKNVYVYQGAGVAARVAGGLRPTGFTMVGTSTVNVGRIEGGLHYFALVYETDSGFLTKPGVFWGLNATNARTIHFTGVMPGPPGTIARHIIATKVIDPVPVPFIDEEQQYFFIEAEFGGVIPDNVTDTATVDFYDSELLRSADYLFDQMETIPAVLGFTTFAGSLVGWAPNTEPASVYFSKAGEPESISLIEGGLEIDPTSGGGVRTCVEYRGQVLMIHKAGKLYTTANNGEEPAYWKVERTDVAVGSSVFGVAAVLDEEGNTVDRYAVASKQGLFVYQGNFENIISDKIKDYWDRINKTAFNKIQVVWDPITDFIAVAVPLDNATLPSHILFCDVGEGLDAADVRWSCWSFPWAPTSIGIDVDELGRPILKIGSLNGNVYFIDPSAQGDNLVAIPQPTFRTAYVGDAEIAVNYFGGMRIRAVGTGSLALQFGGLDDVQTVNPQSLLLSQTPGRILQRDFNVASQFGRLKVWTSNYGDRVRITRISIYHHPQFFEEPA